MDRECSVVETGVERWLQTMEEAMEREIIWTADAPGSTAWTAGGSAFSQAVRAAGLVFVSGQGPFDPTTGAMVAAAAAT